MKSVVVDTNVVVSALIAKGNPRRILDMILLRKLNVCLSDEIYDEYREVLRREKFKRYRGFEEGAREFLRIVQHLGSFVSPRRHFEICSDPDDDMFLDVAVERKVQFLITGNLQHFPTHSFRSIRIVSPSEFVSIIR
jgi:uncharacterized protein